MWYVVGGLSVGALAWLCVSYLVSHPPTWYEDVSPPYDDDGGDDDRPS